MGIRAFIFSGYPHLDECRHFGRLVMPELKTCSCRLNTAASRRRFPRHRLGAGERR
jgi:alkanesulfonate monooxygenase